MALKFNKSPADKRHAAMQRRRDDERLPQFEVDPRNIASKVLRKGDTPLEIMTEHLSQINAETRRIYRHLRLVDPEDNQEEYAARLGTYMQMARETVAVANTVAPYLHPRLSATEIWVDKIAPAAARIDLNTAEELKKLVRGPVRQRELPIIDAVSDGEQFRTMSDMAPETETPDGSGQ